MTRDAVFETLAEVTNSDWVANRGALNAALKSIKAQSGLEGEALVTEIRIRAADYRTVMPDVTLTAPALATHWVRVAAEAERITKPRGYNQSVHSECETCGGNRFVVMSMRTPETTEWMATKGRKASATEKYEETAPCPDCNPIIVTMRRPDGQRISTPDPGQVREMMRR